MWAIHVVHHSSERYNLSTALRQPVADAFGTFAPYGLLCLLGIRPSLVLAGARHQPALPVLDPHRHDPPASDRSSSVLNTPSHHRVHHGVNSEYIDRNHGSILIVWDRLFGTFEPERAQVVYGLTKNIKTFDPGKVMTHEHADMLRDVGRRDDLARAPLVRPPWPGLGLHPHAERPGSPRLSGKQPRRPAAVTGRPGAARSPRRAGGRGRRRRTSLAAEAERPRRHSSKRPGCSPSPSEPGASARSRRRAHATSSRPRATRSRSRRGRRPGRPEEVRDVGGDVEEGAPERHRGAPSGSCPCGSVS